MSRAVFRHSNDEGARLQPTNSRGDALAEKEAVQVSNQYPHPRFPGKSKAYVDAYLAYEARASGAQRTDAERRDVLQSREDADLRADAEHRRSLAAPYYKSYGRDVPTLEHFMPPKSVRAAQPAERNDAVESRIDSAATAGNVSRTDVADHLRMNVAMHRGVVPTDDQIDFAVHTVQLRKIYKPGAPF